jgi:hypothetical protein
MYCIPWAIVDAESSLRKLDHYIDQIQTQWVYKLIDTADPLVSKVFSKAMTLADTPKPVNTPI